MPSSGMPFHPTVLTLPGAVLGALLCGSAVAEDPAMLAARADAVAIVEVSFVPYGNLALLREVLRGDPASVRNPEDFLGECLPPKALVRERVAAGGAAAPIYQAAVEQAGYAAVLMLAREGDTLRPLCDVALTEPVNWESHPRHARWRAALNQALGKR